MEQIRKFSNHLYVVAILACFLPISTPVSALLLGLLFFSTGLKCEWVMRYTPISLKMAIVLMGFGMDLVQVVNISKNGFVDTAISVVVVMLLGVLLGRLFNVEKNTAILVSAGTAICGGSAIAAIGPVLGAKNYQISFSLIVIFVLNTLALIVFPAIGFFFHLSQSDFGYWAAIAIHDTSSVVGAASIYGSEALVVATTVKLARTLWIIPLSIILACVNRGVECKKTSFPWFIGLFVIAMLFAWVFPQMESNFNLLYSLGKRMMVITLFFIGSSISVVEAKKAGLRSFALGVTLWLFIGIATLGVLTYLD
ncbi:MAG: putative sulfate exporter family transporter [Prolixibacteraceae bacterium]